MSPPCRHPPCSRRHWCQSDDTCRTWSCQRLWQSLQAGRLGSRRPIGNLRRPRQARQAQRAQLYLMFKSSRTGHLREQSEGDGNQVFRRSLSEMESHET